LDSSNDNDCKHFYIKLTLKDGKIETISVAFVNSATCDEPGIWTHANNDGKDAGEMIRDWSLYRFSLF